MLERQYRMAAGRAANSFEDYLNGSERSLQEGAAAVIAAWELSFWFEDTEINRNEYMLGILRKHMQMGLSEPEKLTLHLPTLISAFRQLQENPYDMMAYLDLSKAANALEHEGG